MSVKVLYYFGTNPNEDLAEVPSGATYRLQTKNAVVVFEEDEATLLARKDGQGRVLFHDSPTRPAPVKTKASSDDDPQGTGTEEQKARKATKKGGD
jgi:hypothetical protein